jgi:hypothetical protein
MAYATDSIRGALKGMDSKFGWLRGVDLNHRPLGYEPNELPGCSTPHSHYSNTSTRGSNRAESFIERAFDTTKCRSGA